MEPAKKTAAKKATAARGASAVAAKKQDMLEFGDLAPGKSVRIIGGKFLDVIELIQAVTGKDRGNSAQGLRSIIRANFFDAANIIELPNAGI